MTVFLGYNGIRKYGKDINYYDIAKFLAIFFMVIDHTGYFFFPEAFILRGLGRTAFPIFFFLIGYSRQYRFSFNLLIIGILLTLYKGAVINVLFPADILVTAFMVRLVLNFLERKKLLVDYNVLALTLFIIFSHFVTVLILGYGSLGLLFGICGYLKRLENDGEPQKLLPVTLVITVIANYYLQCMFWPDSVNIMYLFSAISIILLYYFLTFRPFSIATPDNIFSNLLLFIARNSLLVYWVHLTVFAILSRIFFPQIFAG